VKHRKSGIANGPFWAAKALLTVAKWLIALGISMQISQPALTIFNPLTEDFTDGSRPDYSSRS
jgi:hypothetical protein